jgi:hypothetical protein
MRHEMGSFPACCAWSKRIDAMRGFRSFLVHVVVGAAIISLVAVVKVVKAGNALGVEGALALFGVCGVAGGLAGAAQFFSHPWVRRSWLAAYLHGTVVVTVYLFGVAGCILAIDRLFPKMADLRDERMLSSWWFWGLLGAPGILGGAYWGHSARADYLAEEQQVKEAN